MRTRLFTLLLLLMTVVSALSLASASPKIKNSKSPRPKGGDIVVRHADKITYDEAQMPGVQIFVGNVEFFHDGVILKCDSANFYQESNSFAAFDHVNMRQGDTLSLNCDYLFYDGNSQVAQARYKVVLKHRKSTLYTDSLDYDRLYSMGYFFEGGRLVDGTTNLTSDWGQYDAQTRQAVFNYNVELLSPEYKMSTDTLYYNVLTKDAHSAGRSNVVSGTTNIYTENGHFNTANDKAILLNRSVVEDNNRKIVADSIVFDKQQGIAEGFGDFVVNDDANHSILTGDYCYYNDSTGYSLAHGRALLKNFAEPDTLFLHADTLKIITYNQKTDSTYRVVHGYYHSRSFREDVQSVADSLSFNSQERRLSLFGNPIVWNGRNQIVGEEIHSFFNDSTIDSIYVVNQALMCEQLDSLNFNQIASKEMHMYFTDGEMRESHAIQNVNINYFQLDDKVKDDTVVIAMNHAETSLMKTYFKDRKVSNVWTAEAEGTFYPIVFVTPRLRYLENFAWFDYIRPRDKYDLFEWRGKPADKVLQKTTRREVPYQTLKKNKK
jgi:lipopolysaccharide export system protein LptA